MFNAPKLNKKYVTKSQGPALCFKFARKSVAGFKSFSSLEISILAIFFDKIW